MVACGTADGAQQVTNLFTSLGEDAQYVSRIWVNVETNPESSCAWQATQATNCDTLTKMVAAIKARGKTAGVFSNIYMWNSIIGVGNCLNLDPSTAIWYPHDDKLPNQYDFVPFGIWTAPSATTLKQYKIDSSDCGQSGNINFLTSPLQEETTY